MAEMVVTTSRSTVAANVMMGLIVEKTREKRYVMLERILEAECKRLKIKVPKK